jgi:hypothetical protein
MPHGDALVALVTLLLVVVTIASIAATWIIAKNQEKLQERISAETAERHAEQRRYEQRSQLLPIWRYLSNLSEINSETATTEIVKTVNTLELVAVCTEAEIIDEVVVFRTFRDKFIKLYEAVISYGELEGYPGEVTGRKLLADSPAATQLFLRLIDERNNRDKPKPLKGSS